jgi:uncharacterized protein (DUF433 family)
MLTISQSPVTSTPGVLGGTIVFTGTRVPAQTLIDYLNDGFTLNEFIEFFPSVSREQAEDFMSLIKDQAS